MQKIQGILISTLSPFENHIANGGEKLLGNAGSIKRRPDERVYVSGQMVRHAIFRAIDRLNLIDSDRGETYVSNGDGISSKIEIDLRGDLGGFMHPSAGSYSGRRTAPLTVTPAVALEPSEIGRDLLVRYKIDKGSDKDQALATKEYSEFDLMQMNFHLDLLNLSISKKYKYDNSFSLKTDYVKHVTESERKRRVKLFIEATRYISEFANQARNAVSGEPVKVLIVFDNMLSRKAIRYFTSSEIEQKNILNELEKRGAKYFIGNDNEENGSVYNAYEKALNLLSNDSTTLIDLSDGDHDIKTFEEVFGKPDIKETEKKETTSKKKKN